MQHDPDSIGGWQHSRIFDEVHAAKEWGMTPSEFRSLPWQDKAEMIAHDRIYADMQAYEIYLAKKQAGRSQKR